MRLKKISKFSYVYIPERLKYDSNVFRDLFNEMKIYGHSDLIQQEFPLWPLTKAIICSALFKIIAFFGLFN
jgi:hypothetical protein